jgi:hypothetical protein
MSATVPKSPKIIVRPRRGRVTMQVVFDSRTNAMLKVLLQAILEESGRRFSTSSMVRRGIRAIYAATMSGTPFERKAKLERLSAELEMLARGSL